jgi:hypothetical protein
MATFDLFRNNGWLKNEQFQRNNSDDTIRKICLKNGILTSSLLVMSFIAFCGYSHQLAVNQLSVINMFILLLGAYFAIQNISIKGKPGTVNYFEGFKVGMYASTIAVGIHALFLLCYTIFDPSIISQIESGRIYSIILNPFTLMAATLFEGLAGAFIITFCLMQYFKKNEGH